MMKLSKDQPFWASVILHLVVLLGVFLATIVQAFKPKEKPHVFEMVDPPSDVSQSAHATPAPQQVQQVEDLPVVELPPVPQVEIPTPQPVVPTPQPTPSPKPTPTPSPKPAPTPQPAPQLMSAEDFFKEHPKEAPKPRRVTTPRASIAVPKIDVPKLVVPRSSTAGQASQQLSSQQLSALADYSSRLRARIDAAWTKPSQLAGVRLVAEVVFNVSASGQISNVRLRPGSGNAAFDQSVLAAFRRASSAGPTPTGQAHEFSLPFRMRD
ncbi:energy transducer TonB [Coraliomargarita sp. SDUM461004]|uniref:Energy transducer TonB n=1 Tax=Thalassobacterium sedimentorum TaxID=3041258 RepID=A0ABU1ANP4_9BACT|nr:energy transducer TonB [Coraliomargarita sp. SDUM461004]MDQ8195233.1 energy transducer TonB [Coraliomargarita sp. SDUM461004]